jgi:mRNA interferase MazF
VAETAVQWGLYRAVLDPVVGSEQAGRRPVLVVSRETVNRTLPIVAVIPLTSRRPGRRVYPTEVLLAPRTAGQPEESIALAHQLRTLSTRRLGVRLGGLEDPELRDQIRAAVRVYLDLET